MERTDAPKVAAEPVRVESIGDGAFWRVVLDRPKGNVIDLAMIRALSRVVVRASGEKTLKAACFEGEGAHFSFGASVEEHLPGSVGTMLPAFHALLRALLESPVVWLASVRGRCLGGGLELAAACRRVFAEPTASLGQPEIALGVFAPAASILLPERIGQARADDLCLTGRIVSGEEALRMGLVDEVGPDPSAAALAWAKTHLFARSASSLRFAARAAAVGRRRRLLEDLDAVERLYLDGLMATKDAEEGLHAFLEKRPPRWVHA